MGHFSANTQPFWQTTALVDMDRDQWESLCDGCGRCCLLKLEDVDEPEGTEERFLYTSVACKLMDCSTGHCSSYDDRLLHVPDCLILTPESLEQQKHWMPETCAYRRLAEGKDLPDWHPLITGRQSSVREADYSIAGWASSEDDLRDQDDLVNFLIAPFHRSDEDERPSYLYQNI